MRLLIGLMALGMAVPAQAQSSGPKKDPVRYTLGFGYREGTVLPPLSLDGDSRSATGVSFLFAEVSERKHRFRGETTALNGLDGLQTHLVDAQSALFHFKGVALDAGTEIRYFEQFASVFTHERSDIRSYRRQGSILFSLMGGAGSFTGTYARFGIIGGVGFIEQSLDLHIDGDDIHRNRSEVASGIPRLFGYRIQGGTALKGLRFEGTGTLLIVDGVSDDVLGNQHLFTGTVSYQTPWFVGFQLRGQASTGTPSFFFLGNSVAAGITVNWPR